MAIDPISIIRQMALLGQNLGQQPPSNYGGGGQITMPTDYLKSTPPPNLNISGEAATPQYPQNTDLINQALAPPATPEETEIEKQGRMLREQYHPSYTAENRLNDLLNQYPQEQKPSLGRTLTAMAVGLGHGGVEAGQKILDEPRSRQLVDWKNQVEPAGRAAEIERQGNVNERYIAQQTINSQIAQQKQDELVRKNQAMEEIANTRANAYEWAKMHPTWKTDMSGPNILSVGPVGPDGKPQVMNLGPTGHLDDRTKLNIQNAGKVAAAEALAGGRVDVANIAADPNRVWNMVPPDSPPGTQPVPYRMNPTTHELERVPIAGGQTPTSGIHKPTGNTKEAGVDQAAKLANLQEQARGSLAELHSIVDEKGKILPKYSGAVGAWRLNPFASVMGGVPGSDYRTFNDSYKRLHDRLTLDLMGSLRALSATGATGFGNMRLYEFKALESAATKLDPGMPKEDFEKEAARIIEYLNKIIQPPDGKTETRTVKPKTAQDYWDEHTGVKK